jgi:glycosyltransferase involved in cell wall biosynthesis
MRETLLISKPIAPPWTDSNKNLVRDLARAFTRTKARVLTPRGVAFDGAISEPIYDAAGAYAPSRRANARVLARLLMGARADVWHFFFAPNPPTLLAGRTAAALRRVATVHTIASAPDQLEHVARYLFADRVVVLSRHTEQRLARVGIEATLIPPALAAVHVDAATIERARARHGLPERYVLYPGDLEHSDGADTFVRAAARCRDAGFGWVVAARPKTPAAHAARAHLEATARSLGAAITWLGELDDIHAVVAGASLVTLVVDTLHAKMDYPLVLLEAMTLGVPTLVAEGTAAAELTTSGGALALPASDAVAFASTCDALMRDRERCTHMGREGCAWVREHCDPAAVAARYEAVYDAVIAAR